MLQFNTSLTTLSLAERCRRLADAGFGSSLAHGLLVNSTLTSLVMYQHLGEERTLVVINALHTNHTLAEVCMRLSSSVEADAVAKVLMTPDCSLVTIDLAG